MEPIIKGESYDQKQLFQAALWIAIFTIAYNVLEGLISLYFGYEDESLTLFGFGADSFIEVISGIGIVHMVIRIQNRPQSSRDGFERTALRITGTAFYLLVAALVFTCLYNIWTNHQPQSTLWGIIISLISIAIMWVLVLGKTKVGKQLNSSAILADAQCTRVCIYMSIILLASSTIYKFTGIPYIDSIGTFGLAYFSFKEGRECFEKANNDKFCCSDC